MAWWHFALRGVSAEVKAKSRAYQWEEMKLKIAQRKAYINLYKKFLSNIPFTDAEKAQVNLIAIPFPSPYPSQP